MTRLHLGLALLYQNPAQPLRERTLGGTRIVVPRRRHVHRHLGVFEEVGRVDVVRCESRCAGRPNPQERDVYVGVTPEDPDQLGVLSRDLRLGESHPVDHRIAPTVDSGASPNEIPSKRRDRPRQHVADESPGPDGEVTIERIVLDPTKRHTHSPHGAPGPGHQFVPLVRPTQSVPPVHDGSSLAGRGDPMTWIRPRCACYL